MQSIRSNVPRRYLTNILLACVCLVVFVFFVSTEKNDIGRSEKSTTPCEVSENHVLVPLERLMKAPVSLSQDDPKLIQLIRKKYLHPPSDKPYNLSGNNDDPSMGQSAKIREILGSDKRDGFFIECGALDGETTSNTLGFEKLNGWQGVLIEGNPTSFNLVLTKNRKAHVVDACLSTAPYPNTVMFQQQFFLGKISENDPNGEDVKGYAKVQCLPLYSILLALGRTTVDYFSLDVEGHELEVLRTIPWDKVDIKTLSVEFIHGIEGKEVLRKYMEDQGYTVHSEVTDPGGYANDYIFVKNEPPKI